MPKCDFNKFAKHGCSPVILLHIFRTPFFKNTSGRLLLRLEIKTQQMKKYPHNIKQKRAIV